MSQRLFGKYNVTKSDGTPTDPKAQYFVLRIDTDPAAMMALGFYAAVQPDHTFRDELHQWMNQIEARKPQRIPLGTRVKCTAQARHECEVDEGFSGFWLHDEEGILKGYGREETFAMQDGSGDYTSWSDGAIVVFFNDTDQIERGLSWRDLLYQIDGEWVPFDKAISLK